MAPTFTDAAAAYFAVAEHAQAISLALPYDTVRRLRDTAAAAQAWLAEHPAEARQHRIRGYVGAIHYALQELATRPDAGERITLALMLQEAADDLAGEARALEQAERDAVADADRRRRLEAEQAAQALPRRAEDIAARIAG